MRPDDLEPNGDSAAVPAPDWPQDVQLGIKRLEKELDEGDWTKKGFWKKKLLLVEEYLSDEQTSQVEKIKSEHKDGELTDEDYYSKLESLLKPSIKFIDDGHVVNEDNSDKENKASNDQKEPPKRTSSVGMSSSSSSSIASSSTAGSSSGAGAFGSVKIKDEEEGVSSSSSKIKSLKQSPRKDDDKLLSPRKEKISKSKGQQSIMAMFARAPPAKRKIEKDEESATKKPKVSRCYECLQKTEDNSNLIMYESHPDQSVEEMLAVTDEQLRIAMDEEDLLSFPQYKITNFNLYCKEGHCVRIDTDLIEKNKEVFMSGYLKSLISEDPGYGESSGEYSRAVKDIGPLYAWWNAGFDGGEIALSGVSTPVAEYYLMDPSELYKPIFTAVQEKAIVTKHVIEFLEEAIQEGGGAKQLGQEWEDMMNYLSLQVTTLDLSEGLDDLLIKHAEFVVHQVYSFEEADEQGDQQRLVNTEAMKQLIRIAGIKIKNLKKKELKMGKNLAAKKVMPAHTEATVTPNVRKTFETVFSDQMRKEEVDNEAGKGKKRKMKCGMCDQCLKLDCGQCRNCKDMTKFGGTGKSKQACMERKCENMAEKGDDEVRDLEDEEVDEEKLSSPLKKIGLEKKTKSKAIFKDVEWVGAGTKIDRKTYYESAIIANDDQRITVVRGDFVLIQPSEPNIPLYIGKISTLYDGPAGAMTLVQWFSRSTDTILGEAGDPTELFQLTDCEDQPLLSIWKKANVKFIPMPKQEEWRKEGGLEPEDANEDDGVNFWYRFHYTPGSARFEYVEPLPECPEEADPITFCPISVKLKEENNRFIPRPLEKDDTEIVSVMWDKAPLKAGDCLYLEPGTVKRIIKTEKREQVAELDKNYDPVEFPEYYRKKGTIKGSNNDTPDPFDIVLVKEFTNDLGEIKMRVQLFYRPENTHKGYTFAEYKYLNELYYSEEKALINFDNVMGRCFVKFIDMNVDDKQIEVWTEEGPDRFFFREWYNSEDKEFEEPPLSAQRIGHIGKRGKGDKAKGKGKSSAKAEESADTEPKEGAQPKYVPVSKPLRCLDIFSGCGGLSQGLHESGIAESCWAVEIFEPAAKAYKLNNDACTVFRDDCNLLLKNAIDGVKENDKKQKIPQQGEVELLCGGPPCQGFSGMNRFNMREYSQFKNSLVSTYLSYCDFYRPKYFILENVRNFASFKKGMVLKLCMQALIKMGYQCTFAILQAGQYGVAQTRRRAILLAAAPGQQLPLYPEPQHVFSKRACSLLVNVDDEEYKSTSRWTRSAPYRTTTVRDMMSDLPKIENGADKVTMSYGGEPRSHIQKMFRKSSTELRDHITKKMAPLIVKRFEFIPTTPGSDWRDLPNWSGELSDGTKIKKLEYRWHDKQQDRGPNGAMRGVCPCASGKKCDPDEKQEKTLIPWCLPHTGNRHNNWAGLYGRVEWDGYFSTTITNPEPMGKQGRVMHPEQTRVVSVRECARSQGFPDSYKFYGTPVEKYRQIGNAVPPALGKALGLAIREAAGASDKKAEN